ncbi:MAG: hypothetical protein IJK97_09670, partial [Thermoguttaceae bacterium]|nr:hypothetical protein [Thermoguttaceae bacterium]
MKTIQKFTVFSVLLAFSMIAISTGFCAEEEKTDDKNIENSAGGSVSIDEKTDADISVSDGSQRDTFEQYRVLIDLI